jgi:hypothetical protein
MGVDTIMSILVLAVIALVIGAFALWRRSGMTRQVWLMLALAVVVVGNLLIWIVPDDSGKAPVVQARQ